jgi:hypothetical protein
LRGFRQAEENEKRFGKTPSGENYSIFSTLIWKNVRIK